MWNGSRPIRWFDRILRDQLRPLQATLIGLGLVLAIVVAVGPVDGSLTATPEAISLVVPVVVASVLGGRRAAYAVVAAATIAFGVMVPPYGSLRVELEQDLVALLVFAVVAILVSTVVARRTELLSEVERQRAAMLRSVSHDSRTPLSIIRAASTELLEGPHHDRETTERMLGLVIDETDRLDRLVANLLDLSRVEAGALEPHLQSIDLPDIVARCSQRLARLFLGIELVTDVDESLPSIEADHVLLDQLVTNLLENAARHSPRGSTVHLGAEQQARDLVITVSDDGPGVAEDQRELIFETFQAVGATAGSGVGLSICKAIVEAHRGSISVGDSPTGGAEFTVRLPLR